MVGAVKAAKNNQNPVTGFTQGYSAVRDDMRHIQQEAHRNYPLISDISELLGGGMGSMAINPILSSAIAGIGYAEGLNDIGDKAVSNVLGNRVANFVPTQVLPKPLNYLANEYINRYAPDWLKDFYQK